MPISSPVSFSYTHIHKRMMVFVDGSNFLIEFAKELCLDFRAHKPPAEAIEAANWLFRPIIIGSAPSTRMDVIRRYWFSSYEGNESDGDLLRESLRNNHFEPVIFKKRRGAKEKRVDIALAKEMLVNAFNQNFDIGLLIAGDADYSDLVKEVKRYGPVIWGSFFSHGLSDSLRIEFDMFISTLNAANDPHYQKAITKLSDVCRNKVNQDL